MLIMKTIAFFFLTGALSMALGRVAQPAEEALKQGDAGFLLGIRGFRPVHCKAKAVLVTVDNTQIGITSSHCLGNGNLSLVAGDIVFGQVKLVRRVSHIAIHPNSTSEMASMAILFFIPFEIDEKIYPLALPEPNEVLPTRNITVFGYIYDLGTIMVKKSLSVVSNTMCVKKGDTYYGTFCAEYYYDLGPALDNKGVLTGFSIPHALDYQANLYIHVGHYVDWIRATVEAHKYPEGRPGVCSTSATSSSSVNGRSSKLYSYFGMLLILNFLLF